MTTLSEDIEMLRELNDCIVKPENMRYAAPLDRIIDILEPLAGLSDSDLEYFIKEHDREVRHHEVAARVYPDEAEFRKGLANANRALAASLTALRGKR